MAQPVSSNLDLRHTLDLILDQLALVLDHEASSILLVEGEQVTRVAARGSFACSAGSQEPYPLIRSPLLRDVPGGDLPPAFTDHPANESFFGRGCQGQSCSCIHVSLRVQRQAIGLLTVNRRSPARYTPAELQVLTAFAQQAALAIENARLYQEANRRARHVEAAAQIARQITLLHDVDQLLAQSVHVIRQAFNYYHAHILIVDPARDELVLQEASGPDAELIKGRGLRLKVGQDGITGWVAYSGEPIMCNDVSREPRFLSVELLPETRSELAVPLRLRGRVIGVLDVQSRQLNAFRDEDVIALQLLGDQIAIAIENARLFQETKGRLEAMQALQDLSLDIVAQLELSELLNTLLQRAARLVHADGAALAVYDAQTRTIRTIANHQTVRDWVGTTLRPGEGLMGYVVETGQAVIVEDYEQWPYADERFLPADQPVMMGVPLKRNERIVGVILVTSRPGGHLFTLEDERVLSAFADLTSIALKNAELFAQVKSFTQTLETQVSQRTGELEQARRQVVEKAEQVQWLLSKTVHIQEEERARIARDLHDSVTQLTIGAMLELQASKAEIDSRSLDAAREKVDTARELLKQVEREIRQAIYDLRPAQLDTSDLLPALQKYAASFEELTGIRCRVECNGTPVRLEPPVEVVIFRIVQEALHNVMTHAQAGRALVSLDFQPARLCLSIEDDGRGMARRRQTSPDRHVGLKSMRERARVIQGQLEVRSRRGRGTRVTLRVALNPGSVLGTVDSS